MLKKLTFIPIFMSFILYLALPAYAGQAYSGIVIDADTGHVLYEHKISQRKYPASLTKMMTLYLIFEALENKSITLDTKWVVSKNATKMPPSKLGVGRGTKITVRDVIHALIIKSANDIAVVAAEELSGSVSQFAKRMNLKAKQLGLKKTYFVNPHGLPDKRQVTTAKDMALLARALYAHFPKYYPYFSKRSFKFSGRTYYTHNRLVGKHGIDGLKTGYTNAAGFNLASSSIKDGRRLIGIVMGGRTAKSRNNQMVKNFKRAYAGLEKNNLPGLKKPPIVFTEKIVLPPDYDKKPLKKFAIKRLQHENQIVAKLWSIQIGSFRDVGEAEKALQEWHKMIAEYSDGNDAIILESQMGHLTLYRSRLTGFSERIDAEEACQQYGKSWPFGCILIEPYQKNLTIVEN